MRRTLAPFPGTLALGALGAIAALAAASCGSGSARQTSIQQQTTTQIQTQSAVYTLDLTRNIDVAETVVPVPVSSVWSALPGVYEEVGLSPAGVLEGAARSFAYRGTMPRRLGGKRASTYLGCGRSLTGDQADEYAVRVFVVTRVEPEGDGEATRIGTSVDASATPRGVSGGSVPCTSTGEIERMIAEAMERRIGG